MVNSCLAEEQVDRMMFHFGVWARASQGCGYLHGWHEEYDALWLMLRPPGWGTCFCHWNHRDRSR